jgi:predicted Zn-dependent peptidase
MNKNVIPKSNLFATFESLEDLCNYLNSFSNSKEKSLAFKVMMLTMNTCYNIVQSELDKELDELENQLRKEYIDGNLAYYHIN